MPDTPAFLAERLKTEAEKTLEFFSPLTDDQWHTEVYTEGTAWTVRSLLAHLVTTERGLLRLFEDIRTGGPGASDDFSIDRYNASQQMKTKDSSPRDLLEQFRTARAEMIAWVSGLTSHDLEKTGRHPYLDVTTLGAMIKMVYRHGHIHQRDLRKVLGIV
jgi:uncharacterized damage-inducible protein DinB